MQKNSGLKLNHDAGSLIEPVDTPSDEDGFERQLKKKRSERDFKEETWFYWMRVAAICTTAFFSFSILFVYWVHLVGVARWYWLDQAGLARIENMAITIIVGVAGTLSTSYFLKKK